jgi:hypothetical protein
MPLFRIVDIGIPDELPDIYNIDLSSLLDSKDYHGSFALRRILALCAWSGAVQSIVANVKGRSIPFEVTSVQVYHPAPSLQDPSRLETLFKECTAHVEGWTEAHIVDAYLRKKVIPNQYQGSIHAEAALMALTYASRSSDDEALQGLVANAATSQHTLEVTMFLYDKLHVITHVYLVLNRNLRRIQKIMLVLLPAWAAVD